MKRRLAIGFIVLYLGTLNAGNLCHMLGFGTGAHPAMYFIVWDMFCGWTAYDSRAHIIAEGESQKLYELAPPPWGELHPWGNLGRQHYDAINSHCWRIGLNTLKHSAHEPIVRMFVVEETWAKKYNVPDAVWNHRHAEPRDVQKYCRVRTVFLPDGTITENYTSWLSQMTGKMLLDNPRLQAESRSSRSLFVLDRDRPGRDVMFPTASNSFLLSSPSGN